VNALRENFGRLHALHVPALARHLIACRAACDGDLDLFLVLTIIGERCFTPQHAPETMSHSEFIERPVATVAPVAINVQSIADYSGIPRETVRRKIDILIDKGWIRRDARKFITVTDAAKDNLFDLTESALRYLADVDAAIRASRPAAGG